jgi:molybdate transport system substrate-binding protein
MRRHVFFTAAIAALFLPATLAAGAEVKVLSAGAFKQVLVALAPEFEKETGHKVVIDNDTVGALIKRIDGGADFDLAVLSPVAIDDLVKKGKIASAGRMPLAKVGIGVVVREGAPRPDISNVEAFKRTLLEAKSVAYIDPAAGGSSGIYVSKLLDQLGIADQIKPKAKLIAGGAVAEHIANGDADIGIHQISEILPVKGVTLAGPLPEEIQNYTIYAAGISAATKQAEAAEAFIKLLSGTRAAAVLKAKGMHPAGP